MTLLQLLISLDENTFLFDPYTVSEKTAAEWIALLEGENDPDLKEYAVLSGESIYLTDANGNYTEDERVFTVLEQATP